MFVLKSFLFVLFVAYIEGQSLFGGRQNPIDRLPGVGACDRIASRGVGNCMGNFLPRNVLSSFTGGSSGGSNGDICCSYSKYRACINGLHAGLKIAMEREKCPKSYSTQIIKSMGDRNVGSQLKSFCGNGGGGSKCPKYSTKPKKNQKPAKRTQNRREEEDSLGLGGLGGLGSSGLGGLGGLGSPGGLGGAGGLGGVFQPVRDVFERGTGSRRGSDESSILSPVRDVFNRGRDTLQQGASSVLGGFQSVLGGLGGGGLGRGDYGGKYN